MSVTEESDAVLQLLKRRLREKAKAESDLIQELHAVKSHLGSVRGMLNSEKQVSALCAAPCACGGLWPERRRLGGDWERAGVGGGEAAGI